MVDIILTNKEELTRNEHISKLRLKPKSKGDIKVECCKHANQGTYKEQQKNNHSNIKHLLMMVACCLAPVGAVLLLQISGYEGVANYLVFLLCPLMHLFMMKGMGHKKQNVLNENNSNK